MDRMTFEIVAGTNTVRMIGFSREVFDINQPPEKDHFSVCEIHEIDMVDRASIRRAARHWAQHVQESCYTERGEMDFALMLPEGLVLSNRVTSPLTKIERAIEHILARPYYRIQHTRYQGSWWNSFDGWVREEGASNYGSQTMELPAGGTWITVQRAPVA